MNKVNVQFYPLSCKSMLNALCMDVYSTLVTRTMDESNDQSPIRNFRVMHYNLIIKYRICMYGTVN